MTNYLGTSLNKDQADELLEIANGKSVADTNANTRKAFIRRGLLRSRMVGNGYDLSDFGRRVVVEIRNRRKIGNLAEHANAIILFSDEQVRNILIAHELSMELNKVQTANNVKNPWYVVIIYGGDGFYAIRRNYALITERLLSPNHSNMIGRDLEQARKWISGYGRILEEERAEQ
jgi:hypothetical protein